MAKKIKKKQDTKEREVPTNPALVKYIDAIVGMAQEIVGENRFHELVQTNIQKGTPSSRSNSLYLFVDEEIFPLICSTNNGSLAYIISNKVNKMFINNELVDAVDEYEPYHYSGFDVLPEYKTTPLYGKHYVTDLVSEIPESEIINDHVRGVHRSKHDFHNILYGGKDIRVVLKYISIIYPFIQMLTNNKFKASPSHSLNILRILIVFKNLVTTYMGYFVVDMIDCLAEKEIYVNECELDRIVPPVTSKFIVKLKETKFEPHEIDFSNEVRDFISFRLFQKTFETFNISQFDIDISELCNHLHNISIFKMTVLKDISKAYGKLDIYSELASLGTPADDEWWNVKEPVVVISNQFVEALLIRNKDTFDIKFLNIEDENIVKYSDPVIKHIQNQFKYILDIFNERMHEFFRLNDKGLSTFDVEVDDTSSHKENKNRHFTPKKTIVKGHVRHYKSGVISYVLPHVRCYEGGEDLVVTLNLK